MENINNHQLSWKLNVVGKSTFSPERRPTDFEFNQLTKVNSKFLDVTSNSANSEKKLLNMNDDYYSFFQPKSLRTRKTGADAQADDISSSISTKVIENVSSPNLLNVPVLPLNRPTSPHVEEIEEDLHSLTSEQQPVLSSTQTIEIVSTADIVDTLSLSPSQEIEDIPSPTPGQQPVLSPTQTIEVVNTPDISDTSSLSAYQEIEDIPSPTPGQRSALSPTQEIEFATTHDIMDSSIIYPSPEIKNIFSPTPEQQSVLSPIQLIELITREIEDIPSPTPGQEPTLSLIEPVQTVPILDRGCEDIPFSEQSIEQKKMDEIEIGEFDITTVIENNGNEISYENFDELSTQISQKRNCDTDADHRALKRLKGNYHEMYQLMDQLKNLQPHCIISAAEDMIPIIRKGLYHGIDINWTSDAIYVFICDGSISMHYSTFSAISHNEGIHMLYIALHGVTRDTYPLHVNGNSAVKIAFKTKSSEEIPLIVISPRVIYT